MMTTYRMVQTLCKKTTFLEEPGLNKVEKNIITETEEMDDSLMPVNSCVNSFGKEKR